MSDREFEEIATVPLSRLSACGQGSVNHQEDAVMLVTDPQQWAYSAEAEIEIPETCNESRALEINVEVESGILGVGLLRNGTWLVRTSSIAEPCNNKLRLVIPAKTPRKTKLVFENCTPGGRPARVVIRRISVVRDWARELAKEPNANQLVVFEHSDAVGLFGILTVCISLAWRCRHYEKTPFFNLRSPNYIDHRYGGNWLEYFFSQKMISEVEQDLALRMARDVFAQNMEASIRMFSVYGSKLTFPGFASLNNALYDIDIAEISDLFFTHFSFKKEIEVAAKKFRDTHFTADRVLGVHYRGGDKKFDEADPVPHDEMICIISEYERNFRSIFLATDDISFYRRCMGAKFRSKIIFSNKPSYAPPKMMERNAPHLTVDDNNYKKGFSAVLDAVLLSRCDLLIKTPSTLSAWCKIFNPGLPLVLVGRPYCNPWPGDIALQGWGYWPESVFHGRDTQFKLKNAIFREIPVETFPYSSQAVKALRRMVPRLTASLAHEIIGFIKEIEDRDCHAPPNVAVIKQWAESLASRCWRSLDSATINDTLDRLLRNEHDLSRIRGLIAEQALARVKSRLEKS